MPADTIAGDAPLLTSHSHCAIHSVARWPWAADAGPAAMQALSAVLARDPTRESRARLGSSEP